MILKRFTCKIILVKLNVSILPDISKRSVHGDSFKLFQLKMLTWKMGKCENGKC